MAGFLRICVGLVGIAVLFGACSGSKEADWAKRRADFDFVGREARDMGKKGTAVATHRGTEQATKHRGVEDRKSTDEQQSGSDGELSIRVTCEDGRPIFRDPKVVLMPGDKALWRLLELEGECRVFGAVVREDGEGRGNEFCRIRFRSKQSVSHGSCVCREGTYELGEGSIVSDECCAKDPGGVNCPREQQQR